MPGREPLLRPDRGTREKMQAWNNRVVAEFLRRSRRRSRALRNTKSKPRLSEPRLATRKARQSSRIRRMPRVRKRLCLRRGKRRRPAAARGAF